MSIKTIDENNVPLKAYLRADPYSQRFKLTPANKELVDDGMFWGENGLYLNYSQIENRKIQISEGITQTSPRQTMLGIECDRWIDENLLESHCSKLYVIQGYAGCGKTTFMNYLMRNGKDISFTYTDMSINWSYTQEPHLFFNELLRQFELMMQEISVMKKKDQRIIWNKFIELASDQKIKNFSIELQNIIPSFKKIKMTSWTWKDLTSNIICYLNDNYSERQNRKRKLWHSVGQTEVITVLLILFRCTLYLENYSNSNHAFVFDNLDVISDPSISSENVLLFWEIMDKFTKCSSEYNLTTKRKLPFFKIIVTVRKILFSHITSQLPVLEMPVHYDPFSAYECDISILFPIKDILRRRISYWKSHHDNVIISKKLERLESLISINSSDSDNFANTVEENEVLKSLNLDAFFNHNYRALSNILSEFVDSSDYDVLFREKENTFTDWQKVSNIIFSLSLLYRKERVWNSMGFGCADFDTIDYPTTINRLILNYLYVSRMGELLHQYLGAKSDFPAENKVTLKQIINTFRKVNFMNIRTKWSEDQINSKKAMTTTGDVEDLLINRLADMCARNPTSVLGNVSGYGADDDEHWRRPMYFIGGVELSHTAATHEELRDYFKSCISQKKSDKILFSITDEGLILIRDIVANFEFYSGRYCDKSNKSLVKPLYQVTTVDEIDALVEPVYDAVKKCCKRTIIFQTEYMKKYGFNINTYLKLYFHARTYPRFEVNYGEKKLLGRSFRPQLHIVRVIYSHIAYFSEVSNYFFNSKMYEKNKICKCLAQWTDRYLKLYMDNFYHILENTMYNSDNNVYTDLCVDNNQLKQRLEQVEKN